MNNYCTEISSIEIADLCTLSITHCIILILRHTKKPADSDKESLEMFGIYDPFTLRNVLLSPHDNLKSSSEYCTLQIYYIKIKKTFLYVKLILRCRSTVVGR